MSLGAFGQPVRLKANAAQQKRFPLLRREDLPAAGEVVQNPLLGELDRPQRGDAERPAVALLGYAGVVLHRDLGVEAAGQHALVFGHCLGVDADVVQPEARQRGQVGVGVGVQPGRDQVDQLDLALLACP